MINSTVKKTSALFLFMIFFGSGYCQDIKSVISPGVLFEALALNHDLPTALRPTYSSPTDLAVSSDGKYLFVAEQTAKRITVIDRATNEVTKRIKLPNEVTGITLSNDDSKIYATCASELWPAGFVHEIDISSAKSVRKTAVGHMARNPVLSPDGNILFVCNTFNNDISFVDVGSMKETKRVEVIREPYSAAITPDGKTLVVGNSLPDEKATDSLKISSKISLINVQNTDDVTHVPLFREREVFGTHSVFGVAITNDSKYAFITHLIGQINIPATIITQGWIHLNNLSIIDLQKKELLNTFTVDIKSDNGAGNPWEVAITENDSFVCIAHSGSEQVSIYRVDELIDLAKEDKSYHNRFLYGLVSRAIIPVKSKGPRALTVHDGKVFTAGYFSEIVEEIDIDIINKGAITEAKLKESMNTINIVESPPAMNALRAGEYYFYSATICAENWQSCHSCHPFTRPDGMNWILNEKTSEQIPKNAKSMLYSWWTPPTNWTAKRATAYESIRMGFQNELHVNYTFLSYETECMDTFFMYLKPVPSPYLSKGKLTDSALKGKEIYEDTKKTDCIVCHPAPLFTKVGESAWSKSFIPDVETNIIIPHLHETWRTSPYDHIGSTTLEEIIKDYDTHTNAGKNLSEKELNYLYEYVLSL